MIPDGRAEPVFRGLSPGKQANKGKASLRLRIRELWKAQHHTQIQALSPKIPCHSGVLALSAQDEVWERKGYSESILQRDSSDSKCKILSFTSAVFAKSIIFTHPLKSKDGSFPSQGGGVVLAGVWNHENIREQQTDPQNGCCKPRAPDPLLTGRHQRVFANAATIHARLWTRSL